MQTRLHSAFLLAVKPLLAEIINQLKEHFDYVSVLGTDDRGISYAALPGETRSYEPMWVQRGFVFRAQRDGKVAEYACGSLPSLSSLDRAATTQTIATIAAEIRTHLEALLADPSLMVFPAIPDEPAQADYRGELNKTLHCRPQLSAQHTYGAA